MYAASVLDHFHNPRNAGPIEDATHHGVAGTPGDGPYMEIWLAIRDSVIEAAGFSTYGCPAAVACGSLTTQLVINRPTQIVELLEPADLIRLLGGLPAGKETCADLAVTALRNALGSKDNG